MKKHSWAILIILIIIWAIFFKVWIGNGQDGFKFSNRENETVFPTPLIKPVDDNLIKEASPASVPTVSTSSGFILEASGSSIIRY